jgi:transcriptional regulator with XRE-family HTH domain
MNTFGQMIVEARKAAGLTQKAVAERPRRGDVARFYHRTSTIWKHDRRFPPENAMTE